MTSGRLPDTLLDVTRLVWRIWRGRQATGIDRVCLAYLQAMGSEALAVVQRRGLRLLFTRGPSDRLFAILREGGPHARHKLIGFFALHGASALMLRPSPGSLYLNVGHTGLNDDSLTRWIARHRLKAVYLIHDLIPVTHPGTCRPGERERHARRLRNALVSATGIIGNSQATLDELADFARSERLPMPPSLAAWIAGKPAARPSGRSPANRPWFVTVGTIESRKNHLLLLDVWEDLVSGLGAATPLLVIIGGRGWEADGVFRRLDQPGRLHGHVLEVKSCTDNQLTDWLAGARALLMPSIAEGYGLPVFEALELGTPVIVTDLAVYREVAGSVPTYLAADDQAAWRRAVEAFLLESPERRRQADLIRSYRAPTWEEHFAKVRPWLQTGQGQNIAFEPVAGSTKGLIRNIEQEIGAD